MRERRDLRTWLIVAGSVLLLTQAALALLWWKLPAWAPRWVAEHAPMPELALRALRHDRAVIFPLLEARTLAWGPAIGPALRRQFAVGDHEHRLNLVALATEAARCLNDLTPDVPAPQWRGQIFSAADLHDLRENLSALALAAVIDGSSYLPSNASYLAHQLRDLRVVPSFSAFLCTQHPPIGEELEPVVRMLGDLSDARAVPALIPLLPIRHKAHPSVEEALARCLDDNCAPHVLAAMRHDHEVVRTWAARQFPRFRAKPELAAQIITLIADPERQVSIAAIHAISETRLTTAGDALLKLAEHGSDPDTRLTAVEAIGVLVHVPAGSFLRSLANTTGSPLRGAAITALGALQDRNDAELLTSILHNEDADLVHRARQALEQMPPSGK